MSIVHSNSFHEVTMESASTHNAILGRFDPKADIPASIVVFLVALPLCLGIALASGAPLFSGIISGIIGGLIVGTFSGSALSVSGPAAGLTVIVLAGIERLGGYPQFAAAVVVAGGLQVVLGFMRAGVIGDFFPAAVIRGMLAAIGLILILKQLPHAVGWDADYEGDESFDQMDGDTTFSEIADALDRLTPGAIILCVVSIAILIAWDSKWLKRVSWARLVPGPLVVVIVGTALARLFHGSKKFAIDEDHYVALPQSISAIGDAMQWPSFDKWMTSGFWMTAVTIAVVASLETLLSIDAADKLDPLRRTTPTSRELKAQGIGNMVAGLLGGLPITAVIVRSTANVTAGGRTKLSTIVHGALLLGAAVVAPRLLNFVPLASLAAILMLTGYKLCKPSLVRDMWRRGYDQAVPFAVTVVAILFTDLLRGIAAGIVVGLFFILRSNFRHAITVMRDGDKVYVGLNGNVSFLNKALLRRKLQEIPDGSYVLVDGTRAAFVDKDIVETVHDFIASAGLRSISVELKRSPTSANPVFKTDSPIVEFAT